MLKPAQQMQLDFYFDPISPYAYLAFEHLPKALEGLTVSVSYKPVLFGAMLAAHGQKGPAEIAGKREWTYRQVLWQAQRLDVVMAMPASHPFNPLALLRTVLGAADDNGGVNRYSAELLLRHVWASTAAGQAVGLDPNEALRLQAFEAQLQQHVATRGDAWRDAHWVKARLRTNTEQALAAGVFGVPTVVAHNEHNAQKAQNQSQTLLFWGLDGLDMLADYLRGGDWFAGSAWHQAGAIPVGMTRA